MGKNIIDSSNPGIVVTETSIRLTDEKLRSILLRVYERAKKDANICKLHNYYSVFLSVSGTLFLSLLTSTFGSIGHIQAKTVNGVVWTICIVSALLGFILLGIHVTSKTKTDTSDRDKAVNEILDEYLFKTQLP